MIHTPFAQAIQEGRMLADLIELCPDGIIGVDRPGTVTIFNRAASRITARPAESVIGKAPIWEVYGSRKLAREIKAAIYNEENGGYGRLDGMDVEIVDAEGGTVPIRLSAVLLTENGEEIGSVGFFHDLSRRKSLEDKLRTLSITDSLTGLYNQRHFHERLAGELARAERYGRDLSLICFDLDRFKDCNDRLGHLEGDNVLRLVGEVLRGVTRRSDQCFRYGGDEFFVLLPETGLEEARRTAEKIRKAFNRRWPFDAAGAAGRGQGVTLSMGVAQRSGEGPADALIKRADLAMYNAKSRGGDRVVALGPDPVMEPDPSDAA